MKFDFCSQSQSQSSRFVSPYFRVGLNGDCWLLHLIRSHHTDEALCWSFTPNSSAAFFHLPSRICSLLLLEELVIPLKLLGLNINNKILRGSNDVFLIKSRV